MNDSAWDQLCALIEASGAAMTFDARRYARAARSWPDCLPPMFGEASPTVERWGTESFGGMWVARRPEDWPAPTVRVGELWEQKSALMATWHDAALLPASSPYRSVRHRVVRIDGERFLNERGFHTPWKDIPGPHWRLLEGAGGVS